jgi:ATP citrate (pro-S)-lyase
VFSRHTRAIVYGMQPGAVQNMLDFDFICSRAQPSVAAIVYEFSPSHHRRFYWGSREVQLPVYSSLAQALARFPEVDTVVSFASSRSVFESTREMLGHAQLRTIALIAEGVPERRTRQLIAAAAARQPPVLLIGPATVGGIKPGAFRIGNTGGMLDNILASKLYRPGSVACTSTSHCSIVFHACFMRVSCVFHVACFLFGCLTRSRCLLPYPQTCRARVASATS